MPVHEFESVVRHHSVPVPRQIPEGSRVKVTVLSNDVPSASPRGKRFKTLLCTVAEDLSDADLARNS